MASAVCACLLMSSCSKTSDAVVVNPEDKLLKVGESYAEGAATKVVLYADRTLTAGYNKMYVALYDSVNSTQKTTNADLVLSPEMTMNMNGMTMKHGCPVEDPSYDATNKLFAGAIAFSMASTTADSWSLAVKINNKENHKTGVASFSLNVAVTTNSSIKSVTLTDGTKLTIAVVAPGKPVVGVNDLELAIYQKKDAYQYLPATGYAIKQDVEMPSMEHGSPNNIDPVETSAGHYKGKVNYTMTGDWRINLSILTDGKAVSNGLYFDQNVR
ncbi:FixH family protein [Danxiaibacter flavus]|uniref:FixH family protein n=1 Tax=Danxiaibacter flavus TaxID=3049108 RepID=A0ABV3ZCI3_9BACT|nr:FixH family protein [Chitinophagaceae bacterium DXS]